MASSSGALIPFSHSSHSHVQQSTCTHTHKQIINDNNNLFLRHINFLFEDLICEYVFASFLPFYFSPVLPTISSQIHVPFIWGWDLRWANTLICPFLAPSVWRHKIMSICKPAKGSSLDNGSTCALILNFPAFTVVGNKCLLCKPTSRWHFVKATHVDEYNTHKGAFGSCLETRQRAQCISSSITVSSEKHGLRNLWKQQSLNVTSTEIK